MRILKLIFFTAGLFIANAAASEENFRAVLEPSTVMEGEAFMLQLSSSGSDQPELLEVPKGFAYQGSSQSTRIVNGKRSSTVGYQFAAPPHGTHRIPPLKVRLGSKQLKTPELLLQVVKDTAAGLGAEDVFARAELGKARRKIYVGEDVPLSVNIYYPQKIRLQLSYPVLDIGKSIFRDFRKSNPENPAFAPVRRGRKVLDEKLFEEVKFSTSFRPLAPGKLTVKGKVNCNILIPEKSRRRDPFDDFWGGGINYRRIARQLTVEIPTLTVLPLPPEPEKGFFLGLVGNYIGKAVLSADSVNALEPVSLDITLRSGGSFESLKVPELSFKDCRVYPGEVRHTAQGCVISYAIIPIKVGTMAIKGDFYYFDPAAGSYKNIAADLQLQVKPSVGKNLPSTSDAEKKSAEPAGKSVEEDTVPTPRTTLLYCKKSPTGAVYSFYRGNRVIFAVMLLLAGPLFWLLAVWLQRSFRRNEDSSEIRREKAGALRNALIEKLRKAPPEDLPLLATGEVVDFLSDRWKMPAGSTPEDVAAAASDKELAEALRECANGSYLPRELAKNAIADPEKVRKLLLNALKTVLIFFAVSVMPDSAAGTVSKKPANWQEALKAYDHGKYTEAKGYFEKYHQDNPADPNVYYNLGCIAEANGEPEMALWYLECAGLLAPHDSAVFENRNVMRSKFFLPRSHSLSTPWEALLLVRDQLHPQDYLVLAALCWFGFFVLLSFRRKLPHAAVWSCGAGLLAVMLLALSLMFSQYKSTYRKDQALVVAKNAAVYTFPGVHNGKQTGTIPGGTPVDIVEEHSDYSLIRARGVEGWTANKNIRKILTD